MDGDGFIYTSTKHPPCLQFEYRRGTQGSETSYGTLPYMGRVWDNKGFLLVKYVNIVGLFAVLVDHIDLEYNVQN